MEMANHVAYIEPPASGYFFTFVKIFMRVAALPLIIGWITATAIIQFMRFRPDWRYWRVCNELPLELLGIVLWEKPDGSGAEYGTGIKRP